MSGVRVALCLLAFAIGGAAGELAAMLFAHVPMGRYAYDLFGLNFPLSLAPGLAAGVLNGAAFGLGRYLQGHHRVSGGPIESRIGVRTMLAFVLVLIALGGLYGLVGGQGWTIPSVIIPTAAIALVSASHGVVAGVSAGLGAPGAAMLGLLFGPVGGGLFGFAAGIAYAVSYQPPPNPGHFGTGGALFPFVIILILGTGAGLGLGVVLACAQGIGRVATRIIGNRASGGPSRPVAGVAA